MLYAGLGHAEADTGLNIIAKHDADPCASGNVATPDNAAARCTVLQECTSPEVLPITRGGVLQDQVAPLGSGTNGQVEAADNLVFGPHVYKWSRAGEDLEGEGMTLLNLRGPHVVQCFGRCREGPGVAQPRHPGCTGLIMERMEADLHQVLVNVQQNRLQ